MTPEEQAELEQCANRIAEILHRNSDPAQLQNLEGIEQTIREQAQAHVLPHLGLFLSQQQPRPQVDTQEN